MESPQPAQPTRPAAWQPFTGKGVAAFAHARTARLLLAQLTVAIIVAGTSVWLLRKTWVPVIGAAVSSLPAEGAIADGNLVWPSREPQMLAENRFLAIAIDPLHSGAVRSPAHVSAEFGNHDVVVYSLLGYLLVEYPKDYRFALNRPEVFPAWGAWRTPILWIISGSVIGGLFILWWLLALLYILPLRLLAFSLNRPLRASGACKLGGASMLAPALFLCGCFVLYGLGLIDPVQLLFAEALHLLFGVSFGIWAVFTLPRLTVSKEVENPFATPKQSDAAPPAQ